MVSPRSRAFRAAGLDRTVNVRGLLVSFTSETTGSPGLNSPQATLRSFGAVLTQTVTGPGLQEHHTPSGKPGLKDKDGRS